MVSWIEKGTDHHDCFSGEMGWRWERECLLDCAAISKHEVFD